jgi:hypothetical protein
MKYAKGDNKVVRRHMEAEHAKEMEEFLKNQANRGDKRVLEDFVIQSSKKSKPMGREERAQLTGLCAKWVTKNLRPIQIVEDEGFVKLMEFSNNLKAKVETPGRTAVSDCIRLLASQNREVIKQRIDSEADYFYATTDTWTSRSMKSFVSFTIHYVTKTFDQVSFNLEVKLFNGKHSGERIAAMLCSIMAKW